MKETIKNFFSLLFATTVWVSGIILPITVFFAVIELDIWYLLPGGVAALIVVGGLWLGKRSKRIETALEYPFGFFSGGPHY